MKKVDFIDIVIIIIFVLIVISLLAIPVTAILGIWDLISGALAAKIIGTSFIVLLTSFAIAGVVMEII